MSNKTKKWIVTAFSLILIGCVLFAGVMSVLKWDFTKMSMEKYELTSYDITKDFVNISINTDTADIVFALSNDSVCRVTCNEEKNAKHLVDVKEDTLTINYENNKKWYEYIGINFGSPKITVFLPKKQYGALAIKGNTGDITIPSYFTFKNVDITASTGDVELFASATDFAKIKLSTGDIFVKDITAKVLNLMVSTGHIVAQNIKCEDLSYEVSTGDAKLEKVECKNIYSTGDTGDTVLKDVVAEHSFKVERSTGNVKLEKCDAAEIFIKTDTGSVVGSLRSDKVFITKTDTGSVKVPKTTSGGKCEIETDTGDIKIEIKYS